LEIKIMDEDTVGDDLLGAMRLKASDLINTPQRWSKFEKDVDKVAVDAELLIKSHAYGFSDDLSGHVMVSVLVDRGANLPAATAAAQCKINVGKEEKVSGIIVRPVEPIPGVDPVNPIFNLSWDTIVPTLGDAGVSITLMADKHVVGKIHFDATGMEGNDGNMKHGIFKIGGGATLRCKVMLRGLKPDKPVGKSQR
jgi:hypothetical protein